MAAANGSGGSEGGVPVGLVLDATSFYAESGGQVGLVLGLLARLQVMAVLGMRQH